MLSFAVFSLPLYGEWGDEEASCATIQCPPPPNHHLSSTSPRVVPHFPLTARSRCIGELLLHVAGTVGSILFTVQTCVSVCCTLLDKDKLTCMTSPSCTFACSLRLIDGPCPWRSLFSSSQRLSSAGSVTTGSRYHQEVRWTVAKGYSIREGFQMAMELYPWLQTFHR